MAAAVGEEELIGTMFCSWVDTELFFNADNQLPAVLTVLSTFFKKIRIKS